MNRSTLLPAVSTLVLTLAGAAASAQPLPYGSLNPAGRVLDFGEGHMAAQDDGRGTCTNGLCLVVTLALADSANPSLCGTQTALDVTLGDQVNICYTVTNASTTALNYQTLSDDHVGTLLDNQNVAIAAGASYQYNRTITASTNQNSTTGTFISSWTATDVAPGYSADATAPFNFVDISVNGTALNLDQGASTVVEMPFAFPFYGKSSSTLCIGNNGEFRFTADCPWSPNINYPLPAENLSGPAVLPYWDVMHANGTIYYATVGTAPNRRFIVEYKNMYSYSGVPTGQAGVTFEAILNEADGTIDFQYQTAAFGGPGSGSDNGATATVGLQASSSLANQFSYDTASLHDGLAIRWTRVPFTAHSASATATLDVGSPTVVTTPSASVGFSPTVLAGSTASAPLLITNTGDRNLEWSLTPPLADAHFPKTPRTVTPFNSPASPPALPGSPLRSNTMSGQATGPEFPFGPNAVPAYGSKVRVGGADFVTFDVLNPGSLTTILPNDHSLSGLTFVNNNLNTVYGVSFLDGHLYAVNTLDGSSTPIGDTGLVTSTVFPGGMRWDPTTGTTYLVIDDLSGAAWKSTLYTIDLATAATTLVGDMPGLLIRDIAIDSSGLMYGIDSQNDLLIAIDKASGATQPIGWIGFDAVYGQGLDFDAQTGVLYLSSALGNEAVYMFSVDPLTGAATFISPMGGEVNGMAIAKPTTICSTPANTPWLSYGQAAGTVLPSDSATVAINFDATNLAIGSYEATLCVYSNDSTESRLALPVTLTVVPNDALFRDGFDGTP